MKNFFSRKVDMRSRLAMVNFLNSQCRYNTMNSWNNSTSYANNVKVDRIIPTEYLDRAYNLLDQQSVYSHFKALFAEWAEKHNYLWQVGFNGKSGGYIVLYQGELESPKNGPKSYCTECGQNNWKLVPPVSPTSEEKLRLMAHDYNGIINSYIINSHAEEILSLGFDRETALKILEDEKGRIKSGSGEFSRTNQCGKCRANARVNYEQIPRQAKIFPGRSTDMGETFEPDEWDMYSLRERVLLVQSFNELCDEVRTLFLSYCEQFTVEEEVIMVPQTRKVLKAIGS